MSILIAGFPTKCPDNCPCETYDCGTNSWAKTCGFSGGFCEMMKDESNPIEYKVNWVRVYQDPNDEKQKVGCSTPERPTKRYIEAHADKYKRKEDVRKILYCFLSTTFFYLPLSVSLCPCWFSESSLEKGDAWRW